jgi:hypothetical protein
LWLVVVVADRLVRLLERRAVERRALGRPPFAMRERTVLERDRGVRPVATRIERERRRRLDVIRLRL